jgi:hypothetical protein
LPYRRLGLSSSRRQRWTIRFQMIPVIPALVKDPLFK